MSDQLQRINEPISTSELERRWSAVRAAMAAERVDVLLMQANNDFMGGYVKYFTDLPATNGYPVTVAFPKDERMTVIAQGPFGAERAFPPEGDGLRRGVGRFLGVPSFASAGYSLAYDAELAERALEPHAGGTIGLVGLGTLPVSLIDRLKRGRLSNAKFVDATDLVDRIKAVKSAEEIAHMRRTAEMQDAAMAAAFAAAEPGKRDIEVAAVAEHYCLDHGSEQGLYLCCSHAPGEPVLFANRHVQNRVMRAGDVFTLLVESNGPGGYYTELGRSCVLGKVSAEMEDELALLLEARRFTLERLVPGASAKEIWDAYNGFLAARGKPAEKRLHCHGMGYDMVERPLVRWDEPMAIGAGMVFACHPTYLTQHLFNSICDNFFLGPSGPAQRLHAFPEAILERG
ncbi:MAG TPA: M24 family metallopeptidase [Alphaproteobacteria bacterium]|nr:M24 family metallopeptidase [Alphaproteobacteria bacterium]